MSKKRIWELDALRGICILGMILFHLYFDLTYMYGLIDWELPDFLASVQLIGGGIFLVLSGLCVTLGSHCVRRGLIVFGCGVACTLVTGLMYWFGFANEGIIIRFGVLHCLGICMLLWPLVKKLPSWALAILGILIAIIGCWIDWGNVYVSVPYLYPLGLIRMDFSSADFYPLLPCLGWFLLGAVLGRILYGRRVTLFPKVNDRLLPLRFLQFVGRHSLPIYLVHQPLLAAILEVVCLIVKK